MDVNSEIQPYEPQITTTDLIDMLIDYRDLAKKYVGTGNFKGYKNSTTGISSLFDTCLSASTSSDVPLIVVFGHEQDSKFDEFTKHCNCETDGQGNRQLYTYLKSKNCVFSYYKGYPSTPSACKQAYEFCMKYGQSDLTAYPFVLGYQKFQDGYEYTEAKSLFDSPDVPTFKSFVNTYLSNTKKEYEKHQSSYPEDDIGSTHKKLEGTLLRTNANLGFSRFSGWNDYSKYNQNPKDTLFQEQKTAVEASHGPMITFHVPYVENEIIGHFLGKDNRGIELEGLGSEFFLSWMNSIRSKELNLSDSQPDGMFVWYCSSQYQAAKDCYDFQRSIGATWDASSPKYTIYGVFEDGTTYSKAYSLTDDDTKATSKSNSRFKWQDQIISYLKLYYEEYEKHKSSKKKRIISRTTDVFSFLKVSYSSQKPYYNIGDTSRNEKAEIGIWNGNLPLVLEQADLCCIPVLVMKGVANCGGHQTLLQSKGFQNWQMSCSMYLSYEHSQWNEGYSELWLEKYTYQSDQKNQIGCPEYGVHWKKSDGETLNVGKFTGPNNGESTGLGFEPYMIEGILSDYFSELEQIDMSKCVIDKDSTVSFGAMGLNGIINNSSPYKIDYNIGGIYQNVDNLKIYAKQSDGIPIVCFYCNKSTNPKLFHYYFQNLTVKTIDEWKNSKANILWGYVDSDSNHNAYEKANLSGEWHKWIGNLSANTDWYSQPFLIKVYDPDRGVDNSFSFDQISSYITKDSNHSENFISFFTTQLSDYYNGVQKKEYYNVTFQDYDGSQIGDVQKLEYGQDATPPTVSRTGYVFTKWVPDYHSVSSDLTCTANYNKEQQQEEEQEENENEGTIRVVKIQDFGKLGTSFTYSDSKNHKLRISNNVIGEILASQNENGLKSQLTEVVYTSQNIKELSSYCFHGCNRLQNLDLLSTNITKLGDSCFEGCSSLTSINLPKNLESLNSKMFSGCTNLKDISLKFSSLGDISQNSLIDSSIENIYLENMTSSDLYQYCSSMLIRFDKNNPNASGEMNSIQLEFGQTWKCPECSYTLDGYKFQGKYTTNSDGSGTVYVVGKEYQFVEGSLTLYAVWSQIKEADSDHIFIVTASLEYSWDKDSYRPGLNKDSARLTSMISSKHVSSFIDSNATKQNVVNALNNAINSDDCELLVFHFSGHGGQGNQPDRGPENETDRKDEFMCMYSDNDQGYEPFYDNELWDILSKAKCRVFTLFCCCHAGTMFQTSREYHETGWEQSCERYFNNNKGNRLMFSASSQNSSTPSLLCWSAGSESALTYMTYNVGHDYMTWLKASYNKMKTLTWDDAWSQYAGKSYSNGDNPTLTPKRSKVGDDFGNYTVFK